MLCLRQCNVYRKGNVSVFASPLMPYFNIFNPLIRARGVGRETIHEKDSKIEKSSKSLGKSWVETKCWCRNNCVVDYNNDQNIVLFLHCSSPEIIRICKFICLKIIKKTLVMSKTQEKVLRWRIGCGWMNEENEKIQLVAPLNDVQTHSYLKASIEAEKHFPRD